MTEGPGKGAWNVKEHQAGTAVEETEAAAVTGTGIMTIEAAMIATMAEKVDMTGKRIENQGDLVVMIQGATEGHVPQGTVLETMIGTGVMTVETDTRYGLVPSLRILACTASSLVFLFGNSHPWGKTQLGVASLRTEKGTCFFHEYTFAL